MISSSDPGPEEGADPGHRAERAPRYGRRPSTTAADLSHVALRLFGERGFDATTIDDVASAAGIARRTFFRYFPSKNDLPWGEFDRELERMRALLYGQSATVPLLEALRVAVVEFNRIPAEEIPWHRERMRLLLTVPALQAHSMLRYAEWRDIVAEFAADRLGLCTDDHAPRAIAWAHLGVTISAYERWLRHDDADLTELVDTSLRMLGTAFTHP